MLFSLLYYCSTEEMRILSHPSIKENKKIVFACKSLQSIHKVSDSRWTQTVLFSMPGSGIDTIVSVFKLFLGITE